MSVSVYSVSSYCYICVLILQYMCPHTAIYIYIYIYIYNTYERVSIQRVLILL